MKEARIRTLEMIVNLTIAKLDILKLRSDGYNWSLISKIEQENLTIVIRRIDELLITLNEELNGKSN